MPPIQRIRSIFEAEDRSGRATNSYVRNIERAEKATGKAQRSTGKRGSSIPQVEKTLSNQMRNIQKTFEKESSLPKNRFQESSLKMEREQQRRFQRINEQQSTKSLESLRGPSSVSKNLAQAKKETSQFTNQVKGSAKIWLDSVRNSAKVSQGRTRELTRGITRVNKSIANSAITLKKGVQSGADKFFTRVTEAGRQFGQAVKAREAARGNTGMSASPQMQAPASMEQLGFDQQASRQQQAFAQTRAKTDLAQKLRNVSLVNDRDTKLSKLGFQRELSQDMDRLREVQREELKDAKKGTKRAIRDDHKAQIADQKFSDKERLVNFDHEKRLNKERLLNTQKRQKLDLDNGHKLARNELANQQKVERQRIAGLHKEAQTRELQRQRGVQQQMKDTQRSDQQRQRTAQREERRAQRARQKAAAPAGGGRGGGAMGGFAGMKQGGVFENISSGTQGLMTAMSLAEGNVMGLAFSLIFLQFASNKTLAVMNALIGTLVLLPGYAIAGALAMGKELDRTGREIAGITQNWDDSRQSTLEAIGMVQEYGGEIEENHKALQELARGGYRDVTAEDAKALQGIALLTGESISSVAAKFVDMKKDAKPFFQLLEDSRLGDKTLWDAMPEKYGDSVEEFFKKFKSGEITQEDFIKGSEILGRVAGETGDKLDKSFGGLDRLMEKFAGDIAKAKFGLFEMIEPGAIRFFEGLRDIFNEFSGALEDASPWITLFAIAVGDFMVSRIQKGVSMVKSLISFVGGLAGRFKEFIDILISAKPEMDFDISDLVGDKMNEKLNAMKDRIVEAIKNGTDGWGLALAGAFWLATGWKKTFKGAFALLALAFFGDDLAKHFFTDEQRAAVIAKLKEKISSWGDDMGYLMAGFLITALTSGITRKFALGVLAAHMTKELLGAITDGLVISQDDPALKAKTETIANAVENAASAAIFAKFMGKSAFVTGLAAAIAGGISLAAGAITENDPKIMPAMDGLAIGVGVTLAAALGPGIAAKVGAMAKGIGSALKGAFVTVGTKAGMVAVAPLKALVGMVSGIGFSIGSAISAKAAIWTASISTKVGVILAASFARIAAVTGVIFGPFLAAIQAFWLGTGLTFLRSIAKFALFAAPIALAFAAIIGGIFVVTQKLWENSKEKEEFQQSFRDNSSETIRGMAEEWIKTNELVLPGMLRGFALMGSNLFQAFLQHVVHNTQRAVTIWREQFTRAIANAGIEIAKKWNKIVGMFSGMPDDTPILGGMAKQIKQMKIGGIGSTQGVTMSAIKAGSDYQALLSRQRNELQKARDEYALIGSGINPELAKEYRQILNDFADPIRGENEGASTATSILNPSQSVIAGALSDINIQGIFDSIADMLPDFESSIIPGLGPDSSDSTPYSRPTPNPISPGESFQDYSNRYQSGVLPSGAPVNPVYNINIHIPDGSTIITQDAIDHIVNEVGGQMNDQVFRSGGSYLPPVGSQS